LTSGFNHAPPVHINSKVRTNQPLFVGSKTFRNDISGAATAAAVAARRAAAPDSDVVARYKAGQAKVIADASK